MKIENKPTIIFTPHYGNYGKLCKQQKVNVDFKIKSLNVFRSLLGVVLFAFLLIFAYLLIAVFVIPQIQEEDEALVAFEQNIEQMQVLELESALSYDKDTGLPIYDKEDLLFCVNAQIPLDEGYTPELEETLGISVDYKVAQALRALTTAAENEGFNLYYSYGYISPEEQDLMYGEKVESLILQQNYTTVMARELAKFSVPRANESEMQTGLSVKLAENPETFETDPLYSWLVKNCVNYGFVFRYTSDKEDLTLHEADPTVLRYVGIEDAKAMRQLGMCLEEYVRHINM